MVNDFDGVSRLPAVEANAMGLDLEAIHQLL